METPGVEGPRRIALTLIIKPALHESAKERTLVTVDALGKDLSYKTERKRHETSVGAMETASASLRCPFVSFRRTLGYLKTPS